MSKYRKFRVNRNINPFRLIPNMITIVSLCVGFSSIRFAFDSKWDLALYSIIIAAILDGIDGRIARFLNASSTFGAELDSLCDFANFGIAPSLLIYFWTFKDFSIKLFSWSAVLFFIVCMVLRLARFNTYINTEDSMKFSKKYFQGVPAPAGAILILAPIILDLEIFKLFEFSCRKFSNFIIIYQFFISILVISSLPTLSLKNIEITEKNLRFYVVFFSIIVIGLFVFTWYILPLLIITYLASIIITTIKYYQEKNLEN